MTEDSICPYTGLRPFTEEESLYFKGRDEHIDQATRQLEKNKFIMLTGASGDGKSSLVYAGIIPNAKAGFLRSQFSNWAITDFRPERTPLGNLCHSLATQLGIANENTVRTELGHGFSALVDMYKASPLFADTHDEEWIALETSQKTLRKRHAANLIIIADQFEEFFTNPENFQKGVPSQEAGLVTNLLLETARIALEENLPIYVIITMRSDFIGQCASFRGLPEAIGFSQFFVPRLNRAQLREVIEEPAKLSGNKISRRLTERLIHDMVEGTDQLPILQHALNQIWKMADAGKSEMDLLHYAMVGGMTGEDLPEQDTRNFKVWFGQLPSKIQACFDQPDLQNVLNTHANKLYTLAADYLKDQYQEEINEKDAHLIIETAFKCLTKIDNSRAVRNRMTLTEITAIINQPHLDYKKVGKVLNIFREPGNTLLRPFFEEVHELQEDSVLDITHESLIRNWENLEAWAKEEFASYTTYLDFSKQLNRWVDSNKSNSFLLYIGPLTYFENFFNKVKPNAAWIARYLGEELDEEVKRSKAMQIIGNAQAFLQRSARKHTITRTIMKYGPRKTAAVLGLIVILTLSSFALTTYLDRRNSAVLENIQEQSISLINNRKLLFADRSALVAEQLRSKVTTIPAVIREVNDPLQKIEMADGIAISLIFQGRTEPAKEIAESLAVTDSLLENFPIPYARAKQLSDYLKNVNEFRVTSGLGYFYNPTDKLLDYQKRNAKRSAACALYVIEKQPSDFDDMLSLSLAIETAVNFNTWSHKDLSKIITALSPFDANKQSAWIANHFKRDQMLVRGYQGYGFNFNGLYQELAYLYAADGQVDKSLMCIDTLLKYNEPYYQRDYTNLLDNATNVASVYYRCNHPDLLDAFVAGYGKRTKMNEIEFYKRLLGRAKPYQLTRNSKYQALFPEDQNLNLQYGEEKEVAFFFEKLRMAIQKSDNADERNFQLAIAYKDEGITTAHHAEVAKRNYDSGRIFACYAKSVAFYEKVSNAYADEKVERFGIAAADIVTESRSDLYLFPDIISTFTPLGARDFHFNYMSASFIDYLIQKNLFSKWYGQSTNLKLIENWLTDYHYHVFAGALLMRNHADAAVLSRLERALSQMNTGNQIDLNLLYLYLGYYNLENNNQQLALTYYSKVKPENFGNIFRYKIFVGYIQSVSLLLVGKGMVCFTQNNRPEDAARFLNFFKRPANRSSLYAFEAREFAEKGMAPSLTGPLLDSAQAEMMRVENSNSEQPNRYRVAIALVTNSPTDGTIQIAKRIIRNQPLKFETLKKMASAISRHRELFMATQLVPSNISAEDQLSFLEYIVRGHADSLPTETEWQEYEKNTPWFNKPQTTRYVDESN